VRVAGNVWQELKIWGNKNLKDRWSSEEGGEP